MLEAVPEIEVHMGNLLSNIIKTVFGWFGAAVEDRIFANLVQILTDVVLKGIQAIVCAGLVAVGGAVATGAIAG